jgi:TIGR03009 family protein
MKTFFGGRIGRILLATACLLAASSLAMAQAPADQYQNQFGYQNPNPTGQPAYPQAGPASQQAGPQYSQPAPAGQPNQPVGPPPYPTIEQRQPPAGQPVYGPPVPPGYGPNSSNGQMQNPGAGPAANQPGNQGPPSGPRVPFVLSPQEAANLDAVLNDWEKRNKEVKSITADMLCWHYDAVFGNGQQPEPIHGGVKYAAPDKGYFELEGEKPKSGQPANSVRPPEKWISDGKSIFKYEFEQKQVREFRLPPELQGKSIADGPLPFVFGAEAQKLKQRYFMRIISVAVGEVWIEAYPRLQQQAADFKKVEIIIKTNGMMPYAIQLFEPNGKDRTVYQLENIVVNPRGSWLPGGNDWFRGSVPFLWKKVVEQPPTQQTARGPGMAGR